MRINLEQKVFDFLADDPVYLEAIRHELAVSDVLERITPLLKRNLQDTIERHVSSKVEDALAGLSRKVDALHAAYRKLHAAYRQSQSEADWWKGDGYGTDYENDDIPF